MADKKALQDLGTVEQQLRCSMCAKQYQEPKLLPCQHSFCMKCLRELPINQVGNSLGLKCPRCHKLVQLPQGGLNNLPSAFTFGSFLDTSQHLPSLVDGQFDSSHKISASEAICKKHLGKLDTYCTVCQKLVCASCTTDNHKTHKCRGISEGYKQEMELALHPIKLQLEALDEVIHAIEQRHSSIQVQGEDAEEKIRTLTRKLITLAQEREERMIWEARKATQQKLSVLSCQKKEALVTKADLQSCVDEVETAMQTRSKQQLVAMKKKLADHAKMVSCQTSVMLIRTLIPAEDADICFHEANEVMDEKELGFLQHTHVWQKCQAEGEGLRNAHKNTAVGFSIFVKHADGSPILIPSSLIFCELVIRNEKQAIDFDIRKEECDHPGRYDVKYTPLRSGPHQLRVMVGGGDIHGSPFMVQVQEPAPKTNDQQLRIIPGLKRPMGVALCGNGNIIVSESAAHRITVIDEEGRKLQSFGSEGMGECQFQMPCGIAVTVDDHILVADSQNNRIQQLTMDGKFIASTEGGQDVLNLPTSVAIYPSGHVFVVDKHQHIQVFDKDLKPVHAVEFRGPKSSRPKAVSALTFNSEGMMYITDRGSGRVKVFDPSGNLLQQFENTKNWNRQLCRPEGVAIDNTGTVFVTEKDGHCVSMFTQNGQFLNSFGSKGSGPGQFNKPRGVAVDSTRNVYVCDSENDRLVVF